MSTQTIFAPRSVVNRILGAPNDQNPVVCVKIPYHGYTVSLAMDSSHTSGDLSRSDIRIYDAQDVEVTGLVMPEAATDGYLRADGQTLKDVLAALDELVAVPA